MQEYGKATQDFDYAISLNAEFAPAYEGRSYDRLALGQPDDAYGDALKARDLDASLTLALGFCGLDRRDYEAAQTPFNSSTDRVGAEFGLAVLNKSKGDLLQSASFRKRAASYVEFIARKEQLERYEAIIAQTKNIPAISKPSQQGKRALVTIAPNLNRPIKTKTELFTHNLINALRANNCKIEVPKAFEKMKQDTNWEVKCDFGTTQTLQLGGDWKGSQLILAVPASAPRMFLPDAQ